VCLVIAATQAAKAFQSKREVYLARKGFSIGFNPRRGIFDCLTSFFCQVVGIAVPPTMPPSPRTSLLPNKKWSSLPLKGSGDDSSVTSVGGKDQARKGSTTASDWKSLNTEATFVCVDTLANLCSACKGENNEMRDVIRTTLDVAKASEDTRAMLGALENIFHVEDLASIVFAKGKITNSEPMARIKYDMSLEMFLFLP
jgi:hypothetical protein